MGRRDDHQHPDERAPVCALPAGGAHPAMGWTGRAPLIGPGWLPSGHPRIRDGGASEHEGVGSLAVKRQQIGLKTRRVIPALRTRGIHLIGIENTFNVCAQTYAALAHHPL